MPILLPGCVQERFPNSKYAKLLRFTELCPRDPLPRPGTLRRERSQLPEALAFALRMPHQAIISQKGPLRIDDAVKTQVAWSLEAAEALKAVAVRFETPASLTPSDRSRDLLAAFAEQLPRADGRLWVWTFTGLWEPAAAYALAEQLGLICSFDPLTLPFTQGKTGYAYLKSLGTRSRLSAQTLRRVASNLHGASMEKVFVALDSTSAFSHALLLQKLIEEPTEVDSLIGDTDIG